MKKRIKVLFQVLCIKSSLLGVISDFLKKLVDDKEGKFLEQFKKLLRGELVEKAISYIVTTFTVTVDETVSVEDAVKAGKFDWSNSDINSTNFFKLMNGQKWKNKEVAIFYFNKRMASKDVIIEMNKVGYKPANIWISIGLAVKEPNLQRKFRIVALGSTSWIRGYRRVSCLRQGGTRRDLDLNYFDDDWDDSHYFLAVHK